MSKQVPITERFWPKVLVRSDDECWEWRAARNRGGYGIISGAKAHRVAWEMRFGLIPVGMLVCHRCDNPGCVNPSHLFLGTHLDNNRDKKSKGRARGGVGAGDRSSRKKINSAAALAIRKIYSGGKTTQSALASSFGITQSAVSLIISESTWKNS